MTATMSPPVQVLSSSSSPPLSRRISLTGAPALPRARLWTPDRFAAKVESSFLSALNGEHLRSISTALQGCYRESCQQDPIAWLPSFCHTLPTGYEQGSALALDVGGSNFRVALVDMQGRNAPGGPTVERLRCDFAIDNRVRNLQGRAFFEWMAERIYDTFAAHPEWVQGPCTLPIGLSWSFPVEQKSIRDGMLLQMGKGLRATDGLIGINLADLVTDACRSRGLNVDVQAIVNDSASSLLSGAYELVSSPIALILGTGLNASVQLPVTALSPSKFGDRPVEWTEAAQNVLVNTEMSLFGKDIFPLTRWDRQLKSTHSAPDFQPMEHLTSGRYLGEIVRLVLVDGIKSTCLFDGATPANFQPYELTTETIAMIEADESPSGVPLLSAAAIMEARHPLPNGRAYSIADIKAIRNIIALVSTRAAAYLAAGVHAIVAHRDAYAPNAAEAQFQDVAIGCHGSVLQKYPEFLARVQSWLDVIMCDQQRKVTLNLTGESALVGAAVATICQKL